MKYLIAGALVLGALVFESAAVAQTEPMAPPAELVAPDARSTASDAEVGQARRAYRNACNRVQSPGYCECVTAGVAQALAPDEVNLAARTIGQRINASVAPPESDVPPAGASSADRIAHVEAFYANSCAQFRG